MKFFFELIKKHPLRVGAILITLIISLIFLSYYINKNLYKSKASYPCGMNVHGQCFGDCPAGQACTNILGSCACISSSLTPTNTPIPAPTNTPRLTPTNTPIPAPTNTPLPTPTNVANCLCETNSQCSSVCPVNQESNYWERAGSNNITYTKPMKCSLSANYYITSPNQDNKNSFCNRSKRPKGDVNGDGKVDFLGDYLNYIQVFVGGKIGPENNPDVNGDGQVTPEDGVIIRGNLPQ